MEELDRWEGVLELCQAMDDAVEVDNEAELFEGKRVLEVSGMDPPKPEG